MEKIAWHTLEGFPWEGKDQKEGYLALIHYLRTMGYNQSVVDPSIAFLIQKNHESQVWWAEVLGNQIKTLQQEIKILQSKIE